MTDGNPERGGEKGNGDKSGFHGVELFETWVAD